MNCSNPLPPSMNCNSPNLSSVCCPPPGNEYDSQISKWAKTIPRLLFIVRCRRELKLIFSDGDPLDSATLASVATLRAALAPDLEVLLWGYSGWVGYSDYIKRGTLVWRSQG